MSTSVLQTKKRKKLVLTVNANETLKSSKKGKKENNLISAREKGKFTNFFFFLKKLLNLNVSVNFNNFLLVSSQN